MIFCLFFWLFDSNILVKSINRNFNFIGKLFAGTSSAITYTFVTCGSSAGTPFSLPRNLTSGWWLKDILCCHGLACFKHMLQEYKITPLPCKGLFFKVWKMMASKKKISPLFITTWKSLLGCLTPSLTHPTSCLYSCKKRWKMDYTLVVIHFRRFQVITNLSLGGG